MCTQRLLRAGADPDTQYDHPEHGLWTPLMGASYAQNQAEVAELTEHGASAAVVDKDMQTPLHVAAVAGEAAIVELLLMAPDAEPDGQDASGNTPAHIACANGHAAVLSVLVQAGANLAATNRSGDTPLHLACEHRHPSCAAVVVDADPATLDLPGDAEASPLHHACAEDQVVTVELLLEAGADFGQLDAVRPLPPPAPFLLLSGGLCVVSTGGRRGKWPSTATTCAASPSSTPLTKTVRKTSSPPAEAVQRLSMACACGQAAGSRSRASTRSRRWSSSPRRR